MPLFPPLADVCDGNMRAIYSLFYNLSHFKKMNKESHGEGGASSNVPTPSRIARPVSPGLKTSYGVGGGASGIPTTSKLAAPSSSSGLTNGPATSAAAQARKNAGESVLSVTQQAAVCVCLFYELWRMWLLRRDPFHTQSLFHTA